MNANFKPWLVLGIIFFAGIMTGVALTYGLGSHFVRPFGAHQIRHDWMAHLTENLDLTPDQQAKIQPILSDTEMKIQALHRDEVERGSQIFKAANEQIATMLTPEQKVELQKMESDREKMFSGHMHRRGAWKDVPSDASTNAPASIDETTNAAPAK